MQLRWKAACDAKEPDYDIAITELEKISNKVKGSEVCLYGGTDVCESLECIDKLRRKKSIWR